LNLRGSKLRDDDRSKQDQQKTHLSQPATSTRKPRPHHSDPDTDTNSPIPHQVLAMPATTAETLSLVTRNVSVAPLVLLSVVDHYHRTEAFKSKSKRVVGVLLGQNDGKNVRVSNSFAGEHNAVLPLGAF
jgi:hypothetical protein